VVNHVSLLISIGDTTVLISLTPNFDNQNFAPAQEYGSYFLTCWWVWGSLPSIF